MGKTKNSRRVAGRSPQSSSKAIDGLSTGGPVDPSLGFPTVPLEELARRQGRNAAVDLSEIGSLWPACFDPDEFLNWLTVERASRRKSDTGGAAESS